jgi:hypothetical protein
MYRRESRRMLDRRVTRPNAVFCRLPNIVPISFERDTSERLIPLIHWPPRNQPQKYQGETYSQGPKELEYDAQPSTCPVCGSMDTVGFRPLRWPSLVISTNIRGSVVPIGKVYRCRAARREVVSSTWIPVDCMHVFVYQFIKS